MGLISTEFTHQKQEVLQALILGHLQALSLDSPLFKRITAFPTRRPRKNRWKKKVDPGILELSRDKRIPL
jgi:hypothetical protein